MTKSILLDNSIINRNVFPRILNSICLYLGGLVLMISNLQQLSVSEHRLSQSQGFWLAGLVASSYVGSVYVSLLIARPRPPLWRNEPAVIKARSLLASFSSILCCSLVYFVARSASNGGTHEDVRMVPTHNVILILSVYFILYAIIVDVWTNSKLDT